MNVRSAVAVAAILGSVAAGGAWTATRPPTPDAHGRHGSQGMKWTATLQSMSGSSVAGTASLAPSSDGKASVATISLTGGKAGSAYPWHIHKGKCGNNSAGLFGSGSAYKPVKVGGDGAGTSTADIKMAPPSSGDYHVNVHASATDMKTIVACGDLSMAM